MSSWTALPTDQRDEEAHPRPVIGRYSLSCLAAMMRSSAARTEGRTYGLPLASR